MDNETEKQALEWFEQKYPVGLTVDREHRQKIKSWVLAAWEARGRASGQQATPNADAVEVAAKAMWDSEPVVFAWGPPERRQASWEEAVERNLVGVEIFRQFARAMLSALAASPQITTPAAQPEAFDAKAVAERILKEGRCAWKLVQVDPYADEPAAQPKHCFGVCDAAKKDGILCPDDGCDIEDGVRSSAQVYCHPCSVAGGADRAIYHDAPACPAAQPSDSVQGWQPIETAPKDGTLLLLALAFDDSRVHQLEDTAELSRTVGWNELADTGEDRWHMAGWSWEYDQFTNGRGVPVLWRLFPEPPGGT